MSCILNVGKAYPTTLSPLGQAILEYSVLFSTFSGHIVTLHTVLPLIP